MSDDKGTKPDDSDAKPEGEAANNNKGKIAAGVAVGIGSAALVAALLYSNRGKKTPKR